VLNSHEIHVSWDAVHPSMVSKGLLLGFKIYYRSDGEPERTIILVEDVVEHTIRELSKSTFVLQWTIFCHYNADRCWFI